MNDTDLLHKIWDMPHYLMTEEETLEIGQLLAARASAVLIIEALQIAYNNGAAEALKRLEEHTQETGCKFMNANYTVLSMHEREG